MKREMSVSGSFYPQKAVEIERYFKHFNDIYTKNFELPSAKSRVVIVPHAGYVYSGYTANIAYKVLQKSGVKKFVIIGPSHRVAFDGVSLGDFSSYETPFGDLDADVEMGKKLKEKFALSYFGEAHHEHSTEVQFPFIKHYVLDAKVVELVYGRVKASKLYEIINFVLAQDDYGLIISTDLSHFYNLQDANNLDKICLKAIEKLDEELLQSGCEACGITGVKAMIMSAKELSLSSNLLDYRTSADASGDEKRVVGYMSAYFS
jgi:AmmeMemoRadiSam system protein B